MQACSTRCSASSYRATGVCYYGCRCSYGCRPAAPCSTRCSASSYRATGVRYYGCRPAATRCRAFRRRLQEHGCAAGVAQPNVVAAGIDLGRAADGARLVAATAFIVAALACEVVVTAPAAARVAAHCRQLRRRTQRRGQASGTEDEARRLGACGHDGTASVVARRSSTRCLPMTGARGRRATLRRSIVDLDQTCPDWGDNKSTFRAFFFERFFRKLRRQDKPP